MIRQLSVVAGVAVGAALCSCGGNGAGANVTAAEFAACIEKNKPAGVTVETDASEMKAYIETAGDGALEVHWRDQQANIAIERSADDAKRREQSIKDYVEQFGMDGGNIDRDGTVVIQWTSTPGEGERDLLEACL